MGCAPPAPPCSVFEDYSCRRRSAFLAEFSATAKLTVPFTAHGQDILDALSKAKPGGLTAMLDGINVACARDEQSQNSRKATVVISDGGDNNSERGADRSALRARGRCADLRQLGVFGGPKLALRISPEIVSGPRPLSEIATQTGGRAFSGGAGERPGQTSPPESPVELRNQYVLG